MPTLSEAVSGARITVDCDKTYVPGSVALKRTNLAVEPGEVAALAGPVGCGKTTLLRIVAGLASADAGGAIFFNGEDVSARLRPCRHGRIPGARGVGSERLEASSRRRRDHRRPDGFRPSHEYAHLREILADLRCPMYLLPGNHDDRAALHDASPDHAYLPHTGFCQYAVDLGGLRLVTADTVVPGAPHGMLDEARIADLDRLLGAAPDATTIVAQTSARSPISGATRPRPARRWRSR